MTNSCLPNNRLLYSLGLLLLVSSRAFSGDAVIPPDRHSWAAFRPGSWKLVRVSAKALDENGTPTSTSVTETRTLLLAVDATGFDLQVDVTLEKGGKRFDSLPRFTRQGLHGESEGQQLTVRRLGKDVVKIGERKLDTQVVELEIADKDMRKITRLNLALANHPFVLARQSTAVNPDGDTLQETHVEVTDLRVPRKVLGAWRTTWRTVTIQKHAAGRIVTEEVHCFDIPGGVVEHTSNEFNDQGKLISQSQLEMLNYGIITTETALKRRHASRRSRRAGAK